MADPKPGARQKRAGAEPGEEGLGRSMTIGEPLEELRVCVRNAVIAFVGALALCLIFQDWLTERVAVWPYQHARELLAAEGRDPGPLQAIEVTEKFFFYFRVAMYAAFVLSAPFILAQVWRFVGAGLYPAERRAVMRVLPVSIVLFMLGVAFGFVIVVPTALAFLLDYGDPTMFASGLRADAYNGFFLFMCLILGGVFELPLLQAVLAKFDLVSPRTMASKRRAFIIGATVASAVLTPTGDAITMSLVALPIVVLYEVGILVAKRVAPKDDVAVVAKSAGDAS
ncbi:MAG: twin-arginine translocase subunit TatC [Planctomycetes bacterium]|nr:twin-arginine translocase subunit TatC [Planctomycetota bacterium]